MVDTIYFYEAGSPESGVVGSLSIDKGQFVHVEGAALDFVPSARLRLAGDEDTSVLVSDQQIFDYLANNWTNGNTFTLAAVLTPEQVAEFVG